MLDIVASYHYMQFQGKRMIQSQEIGIKPYFGHDLDELQPNFEGYIMVSYHHV